MQQSTKKYLVHYQQGKFKVYTTDHGNNMFVGGILYFNKTGTWSDSTDALMDFDYKYFLGRTEDDVYKQTIDWMENKFGKQYKIESIG